MKKIKFVNLKTGNDFSKNCATLEEETQYIEWCKTLECIGKPEREIVEFSESYDEADVISRRNGDVYEIGEIPISYVTLRAEYEITVEDLSQNEEWLLQECYRKRLEEYPTLAEISEALMEKFGENRYEKFEALHLKRMEVKKKYPKPVRRGL